MRGIQISIHRIEQKLRFQIDLIAGEGRFRNDFVVAIRHRSSTGIAPVLRHIDFLFAAVGYIHANVAILKLECRQTGIIPRLHAAGIQLDDAGAAGTLRPLGQRIPGIQQICRKRFIGQPQPARPIRQRPCGIVRIMVPLPQQIQLIAAVAEIIIPCQEGACIIPIDFHSHRSFPIYAHHRPAIFPGHRHKHRDSTHGAMILKQHAVPLAIRRIHNATLGTPLP